MTSQKTSPVISTNQLTNSKLIRFLTTLKRLRFNGKLVLTDPNQSKWIFYLYQGSLLYATGGDHPARRWRRNLQVHSPEISGNSSPGDLGGSEVAKSTISWEYQQLYLSVTQQKITQKQAAKIIHAILAEVLFDVIQSTDVNHEIQADNNLSRPIVLIDVEKAIAEVEILWQAWENANLSNYSPNKAPIIKQPNELRKHKSAEVYQTLTKLLDGENTLRDIAIQMKRDIVEITRSLLPYIQLQWLDLISIPDLPVSVGEGIPGGVPPTPDIIKPLIACVDDNLLVCHTMEKLITGAGYRFVGINDAVRAIAILLSRKPDLIFLDLVMPNANGYEICEQLRKISYFHRTPILILTGKDGHADRLRAKFVGASGFLSKPLNHDLLLEVIYRHLEKKVTSQ